MKKEIAVGTCFVIAGILCTCLFGYSYFTTYGFLNAYHMNAFASSQTDFVTLLGNIVWERGKLMLFLAILSLTALKPVMPLILRCLICFTCGIFLAACVMNMGWLGIVFFLVSWFPHGMFYIAGLVLLLHVDVHRFYNRRNPVVKKTAFYMGIIVLVLAGCMLEASVGTKLLKMVANAVRIS